MVIRRAEIRIRLRDGTRYKLHARILGAWCYHPTYKGNGYTVTHARTGKAIVHDLPRAIARRIVTLLSRGEDAHAIPM